jgi:chromosome segregation ATPase
MDGDRNSPRRRSSSKPFERRLIMDQKLELILKKLSSLESGQKELNQKFEALESGQKELNNKFEVLESGQKELGQIVRTIRDRQEETDAKIDALSMDVHHVHGEIAGVKEEIKDLRNGVIFVNRKVADAEFEINMMKQNKNQ